MLLAEALPVTSSVDNVPTDVMLGCAAVVNVPVSNVALTLLTANVLVLELNVKLGLAPKSPSSL